MKPYLMVFGISIDMYKMFFFIALASVPVVLFCLRKRFDFSVKQAAFYSTFTLVFGYISAMLTAELKHVMLSYASGGTYVDAERLRNYGIPMFLPLFLLAYCLVRKDDYRKLSDYIAPCVYTVMTFVKIGCVFFGCCYGEPSAHGIWNEMLGYRTFPVQLYDSITSLIIVLICLYLIKRFYGIYSGYIYPIGGILFAITKGFWENFRVHESEYERSYLGTGWTLWQYWLLVLFLGCVLWIYMLMREDKIKVSDLWSGIKPVSTGKETIDSTKKDPAVKPQTSSGNKKSQSATKKKHKSKRR